MKKSTTMKLLDVPGAQVSFSNDVLKIESKVTSPPWFKGSLEVGVLLAMPRVGVPMTIDETDPLSFGRFVAPDLLDTFTDPPTLRKFLNLREEEAGAYVKSIDRGSESLARSVVDVLKNMPKDPDWKIRLARDSRLDLSMP